MRYSSLKCGEVQYTNTVQRSTSRCSAVIMIGTLCDIMTKILIVGNGYVNTQIVAVRLIRDV
jgi:hypothetical protein